MDRIYVERLAEIMEQSVEAAKQRVKDKEKWLAEEKVELDTLKSIHLALQKYARVVR